MTTGISLEKLTTRESLFARWFQFFQPRRREQRGDDRELTREQALHHFDVGRDQHPGPLVFLHALEGQIQSQFRRVERFNGFDMRDGHAGIKAAGGGNEKRGEKQSKNNPAKFRRFCLNETMKPPITLPT